MDTTAVERNCTTCNNLTKNFTAIAPLCWECTSFKSLIHWEPKEEKLNAESPFQGKLDALSYARLHGAEEETALNSQVGGSHYKDLKIQPVEFIHANNIPFLEGNVIKYVCRWKVKNGIKDLEKAKHYIELLLEMEGKQDDN